MGDVTAIQWTDHTFNPWIGCQRVSPGCENCYAEARDQRFNDGAGWGPKGVRRVTSAGNWSKPRKWDREAKAAGKRARVFCASLADVFEDRPELVEPRARLFALIAETPNLDWLLLTKRPENMTRLALPACPGEWPANVWAGTTTEDQKRADDRIPHLLQVRARVRFLSVEPQIGPVDLWTARYPWPNGGGGLGSAFAWGKGVHWVIVGGESGHGARPFHLQWARDIAAQCEAAGVACFVKQMGEKPMDAFGGRPPVPLTFINHKGGDIAEFPPELRVRAWPVPR